MKSSLRVISALFLLPGLLFAHAGGRDIRGTIVKIEKDSVVVKRVDAIAVYRNPEGDIVIRQERRGGNEDNIVIVPGQYAYTLVESIQRLLKGQLFSLSGDTR